MKTTGMKHELRIHPAANIFPRMEPEAYKALVEDIRKNGQQESCVFYEDQLLDGRNRWNACQELGIEPHECMIETSPDFDPLAYVLSANLHRRHLNPAQQAMVAARVKSMYEPAAKERQREAGRKHGNGKERQVQPKQLTANLREATCSEQAGAVLHISGRSVDDASTVLKKGSKELIAAVEQGKVAVSRAATVARTVPRQEQMEALSTSQRKNGFHTKSALDLPVFGNQADWDAINHALEPAHKLARQWPKGKSLRVFILQVKNLLKHLEKVEEIENGKTSE
jgi:hypothetical protein